MSALGPVFALAFAGAYIGGAHYTWEVSRNWWSLDYGGYRPASTFERIFAASMWSLFLPLSRLP